MPNLKLIYFDFDGGRGEPLRIALSMGNIPFEDHRFPVAQFQEYSDRTPLRQVPVMEIDGEEVTQTNALLRYVGKMTGLYPDDALEALYCDEAMDMAEDISTQVVRTFRMEDEEEKRLAREALCAGPLRMYLARFAYLLDKRGGKFLAGDQLTIADLKIFLWVRNLRSGILDYIPTSLVEQVAPSLVEYFERINAEPGVVDYYKKRAAAG
jgi:glutathione S-transferase